MKDLTNYSAKDARRISDSLTIEKHSEELKRIIGFIDNRANKGEKDYFCFNLSSPVR